MKQVQKRLCTGEAAILEVTWIAEVSKFNYVEEKMKSLRRKRGTKRLRKNRFKVYFERRVPIGLKLRLRRGLVYETIRVVRRSMELA